MPVLPLASTPSAMHDLPRLMSEPRANRALAVYSFTRGIAKVPQVVSSLLERRVYASGEEW